jgi:uncharacterized protein YgbK (DUF1537 family)
MAPLHKIVVLDDDPTGCQTVHGVPVLLRWDEAALREAFGDPAPLVFLLTNSRALNAEGTRRLHEELLRGLASPG